MYRETETYKLSCGHNAVTVEAGFRYRMTLFPLFPLIDRAACVGLVYIRVFRCVSSGQSSAVIGALRRMLR